MFHRYIVALACAATAFPSLTAVAAEPIKIGFPIPLSGPTAVYGKPVLKGAELAVSEINAKGGASSKSCRATAKPAPMRQCGWRAS